MLGCGDVGNVFLVQSYGLEEGRNGLYAMKVITKADIIKRNKIPVRNYTLEICVDYFL